MTFIVKFPNGQTARARPLDAKGAKQTPAEDRKVLKALEARYWKLAFEIVQVDGMIGVKRKKLGMPPFDPENEK